jgi:hypothetical protein
VQVAVSGVFTIQSTMATLPRLQTIFLTAAAGFILIFLFFADSSVDPANEHGDRAAYWPTSPGNPTTALRAGAFLDRTPLESSSGRYRFSLLPSGKLLLRDLKAKTDLLTTGSSSKTAVTWHAELAESGELQLFSTYAAKKPLTVEAWTSSRLPGCRPNSQTEGVEVELVLELLDTGKLQIRSGSKSICVLYDPPGAEDH